MFQSLRRKPVPKEPDIASDDVITHGIVPFLELDERDDLALVNKRMHRLVNKNPCYHSSCNQQYRMDKLD